MLTEHQEQQEVINWARIMTVHKPLFFKPLKLLHAIPNGGRRDPKTAFKLKREGVLPGIPDLFLPWANKGYNGLYIEMKSKKGKLTKIQKERIKELQENGYKVEICFGAISAIKTITKYLETEDKNNLGIYEYIPENYSQQKIKFKK